MSDRANEPVHATETELFYARLRPHRSLSAANFRVLLMVFGGAAFFTSLPFVILGAWPVAGFMGLDVALVWFAFRANYRAANAYEDVRLTPILLDVERMSHKGVHRRWSFNPVWVRIEREEDEEFGTQRVALASRGRSLEVGNFLGPDDKAAFADRLSRALSEARRGPRFS